VICFALLFLFWKFTQFHCVTPPLPLTSGGDVTHHFLEDIFKQPLPKRFISSVYATLGSNPNHTTDHIEENVWASVIENTRTILRYQQRDAIFWALLNVFRSWHTCRYVLEMCRDTEMLAKSENWSGCFDRMWFGATTSWMYSSCQSGRCEELPWHLTGWNTPAHSKENYNDHLYNFGSLKTSLQWTTSIRKYGELWLWKIDLHSRQYWGIYQNMATCLDKMDASELDFVILD